MESFNIFKVGVQKIEEDTEQLWCSNASTDARLFVGARPGGDVVAGVIPGVVGP